MLLTLSSCQMPKVADPLTRVPTTDPVDDQLTFWHTLETRPLTCNDEAFHGLLLFTQGQDDNKTYEDRVNKLKSLNLLSKHFNSPADAAVQRGTVAAILVKALKIQGGWALTVAGPLPRYATRELVYMNLFPPSSPEQTFSGSDFVGIIGRAEDYQRGNPGEAPATAVNQN